MNENSDSGDLTLDAINAIRGTSLPDQELIIQDYMSYLEQLNKNKATLLEQNMEMSEKVDTKNVLIG